MKPRFQRGDFAVTRRTIPETIRFDPKQRTIPGLSCNSAITIVAVARTKAGIRYEAIHNGEHYWFYDDDLSSPLGGLS